jgi:hypothetical protein
VRGSVAQFDRSRSRPGSCRNRRDDIPLTDVQWVLGHAHLSTTQLYLTPLTDDVIASVLSHYARRAEEQTSPTPSEPASLRYRPESLDVLFGRSPS